eukprot:jgi/Picsp_1/766/NSC_04255-R1_alkaline serine protease
MVALRVVTFVSTLVLLISAGWVQSKGVNAKKDEKEDVMVLFNDFRALLQLKAVCSVTKAGFEAKALLLGLPMDCHMPGICRRVWSTLLPGFSGKMTKEEKEKLERCIPRAVMYEEPDQLVVKAEDWRGRPNILDNSTVLSFDGKGNKYFKAQADIDTSLVKAVSGSESNPKQGLDPSLWSLDRIDQRELPLDGSYKFGSEEMETGKGVTIYVIDSGVRSSHQEFAKADGTGSRVKSGYDFVSDDEDASDCDGHGTHTSGTAAGIKVGVAKGADIVSVRILDCDGSGSVSDTVAALDWVAEHAQKPSVALLSLGIPTGSWSKILEDATRALVRDFGVTTVVASGNSQVDACYIAPANVPEVITVAATDIADKFTAKPANIDAIYYWSNLGSCVDLFAPGVDIYSACGSDKRCEKLSDKAYTMSTGTSMAAPQVAGVAALYLQKHPDATPAEVKDAILSSATEDAIDERFFMSGTPNSLLYSNLHANAVTSFEGPPQP